MKKYQRPTLEVLTISSEQAMLESSVAIDIVDDFQPIDQQDARQELFDRLFPLPF